MAAGLAACDPAGSATPPPGTIQAGHYPAAGTSIEADDGGHADAEHLGLRREHDDESGNFRHDGAGQRHGRGGDARGIAAGC